MTIGRNDLCPCGSGKKYKKCCLNKTKESKWKENFDKIDITISKKSELKEILFQSYEFMEKEDWKGACHAISAVQYILFNELGLNTRLCIGVVECDKGLFDHSWVEIENKVYDIAIDNTLQGIKVSEPIIFGLNIETLEKTSIKYGVKGELDCPARNIKELDITTYMDGYPDNLLWKLVLDLSKNINLDLDIEQLRETYSKIKRIKIQNLF